ncbi:MAG: hypothetical protein KF871_14385 [Hydrogenophaga sp.]|uniref:N-ATPase subunit AtpR n=1 Tax=Hydrogenophaga sp. TaxID=1904254 RepID=UPI001DBAA86B|nr:ATP synthase subunit I [Hydrogenophaga sp.]MBX3611075.1 hypothetical protein [Hydrogenophaga sp.]
MNDWWTLIGHAGAGGLAGAAYFGSLRWLVHRLIERNTRTWWLLALVHLARIAAMGAAMWWAVTSGAGALIAFALGVLLARQFLVGQVRKDVTP